MKRTTFGSIADWFSFRGASVLDVEDKGARRVTVEWVTEGGSLIWTDADGDTLLASGSGHFVVEFGVTGAGAVSVVGRESLHSVRMDGRQPREVGWVGAPSHTSLDPVEVGTMSPEVQKMFAIMQHNLLGLRAELEQARTKRQP